MTPDDEKKNVFKRIEKLKSQNRALAQRSDESLEHKDFLVVFINPPMKIEEIYGKYQDLASFQPPVGLCCVAAYLLQFGYRVKIIDANVNRMDLDQIVQEVKKSRPNLIGLYTITPNFAVVEKLVKELKQAFQIPLVAGGPHVHFMPRESLSDTKLDYVVVGEGEETLLELSRQIESGKYDLQTIDGLGFKTANGEITLNKNRIRKVDLDHLPFPAVHLLPNIQEYKLYLLHHKRQPYMTVITSRGCPFKCVFCDTPFGKQMSYHSPEYTVAYLEYLCEDFGVREIHFCDDTFTLKENRIRELCNLIIERKTDVTWYAATRADLKDRSLFKIMKQAGCWIVAIGAETGDAEIMKNIGKQVRLDDIECTCRAVRKAGLKLKVFFILGHPGETLKTIERTIAFARRLRAHYPVFSLMTPFPGAPLWSTAEQFGHFDRKNFRKLLISTTDPVFVPFGLTTEILLTKQKQAFRKTYYNPGMIWRQLYAIRTFKDAINLFRAFFAFVKVQA